MSFPVVDPSAIAPTTTRPGEPCAVDFTTRVFAVGASLGDDGHASEP